MTVAADPRAPTHADWPSRFEVVARVTKVFHCANFIREGQEYVFSLDGVIDPGRSNAALCLGILAKLQPALLLAQDRAASGLHPISPGWHSFDCFDTGVDHGGTGKVYVRLELRERATGRTVADAAKE